jgi:transcriptional regulator with XRE-family HTH domain
VISLNVLNISDNIIRYRHEKNITQEELADFIGVTKASVSKWENKQSLPDILLLPQLAAFFDVSVDELLGYEAQLSREQIQKLYSELAADFAALPFDDVLERSRALVRRYYSCYPFLIQICVLWLNHFSLTKDDNKQKEILLQASELCDHIIKSCKVIGICNDAVALKTVFDLQLGKTEEVIETLESILDPTHFSNQNDTLLIQAYKAAGNIDKAQSYTQVTMYMHLISLVTSSIQYLTINMDNLAVCEKTIRYVDGLIKLFDLNTLNPNSSAQFFYHSAIVYMMHRENEKALKQLDQYERSVRILLTGSNLSLHGNSYFNRLDEWFGKLELGAAPPRDKRLVKENVLQSFEHPLFAEIKDTAEFQRIVRSFKEGVVD